jgi:DNA-binding PadR family transcriptional regulator
MNNVTLNTTLSWQEFYTLLALTQRSRIGYDIIQQIAIDSDSRLIVASGTLYPLLKRLTTAGLITRNDRHYSLTRRGRHQLEREIARLEHAAIDARRKLDQKFA